jgi:hypothetical protein
MKQNPLLSSLTTLFCVQPSCTPATWATPPALNHLVYQLHGASGSHSLASSGSVFLCNSGDWTQGLKLSRQAPYHLSHVLLVLVWFSGRVSPQVALNYDPPTSTSWVAGITGATTPCPRFLFSSYSYAFSSPKIIYGNRAGLGGAPGSLWYGNQVCK